MILKRAPRIFWHHKIFWRKLMEVFNVLREVRELKNQLSYSKNIGFFFGAGSSCALGIPNIAQLTNEIEKSLTPNLKKYFKIIKKDLISISTKLITIEDVLNQVRRIREITGERKVPIAK